MLIKPLRTIVRNCIFSTTVLFIGVSSQAMAGWQLQWMDDFDGTRVDRDNWTSQVQANYNNEVQCYTDDDTSSVKNYDVSNGTLKIIARRQANNCAGLGGTFKNWTSGRLNSKDKREFLYGRIESRIKLDNVKAGSWPAFWMLENRINEHPIAGDGDTVGWPNPGAGEIDVWEWYANSPHSYITNFFNTGENCGNEVRYTYPNGSADVLDWHTYAMEWNQSAIKFYMDDLLVSSQDISDCAQYKEPMFVLLNMAMGGNLGGAIDSTLNTATMEIDYVAHCIETNENDLTRCNASALTTQDNSTNDGPTVSSSPVTSVISGNAYAYTLTTESTDNVTMAATVLPSWLSFNSDTGRLSGTPSSSDTGLHSVSIDLTDSTGTRTESFDITVFVTGSGSGSDSSGGGSMGLLLLLLGSSLLVIRSKFRIV